MVEHRIVEIEYESVGKPSSVRRIEPYGLAVYQSSIYVVAAAEEVEDSSERLRHWKLDRFRHAKALDEYFKPDPSIDLESHLGRSIGIFSGDDPTIVKIKLKGRAASWVREDPWHPEQKLESLADGTEILSVPASHPRELLPKVLSLASDAEVIEPDSFREAIAESVKSMAAHYQSS